MMCARANAGWAYRSITPYGKRVSLAGQYYERITEDVDCELMVAALAMGKGGASFTWAVCDIVGITDRLMEAVKRNIERERPDISSKNIMMSAIHTHNAPYVKYSNILGRSGYFKEHPGLMTDGEYHDFIVKQITKAVIEANDRKKQAYNLIPGELNVKTGYNRRGILRNGEAVMYIDTSRDDFSRMEGPDGGAVNIIALRDDEGIPRGIVACIPCTSQVMEHQYTMSSDYTGRIREMLRERFGDDFLFLPLISASGDQSPRNLLSKDPEETGMYSGEGADELAERIFNGIMGEIKKTVNIAEQEQLIAIKKKQLSLPGWIPSHDDYEWAKEIIGTEAVVYDISDYVQKGVEPYYKKPLALAKKAESIITKYENPKEYETVDIEITAIRLGGIAWVTNPFELFIEYGNRISSGAIAESVWPIQLANGYEGYFPTHEAVLAGGYSAYIQSSRVKTPEAGELLVKESINLVNSLFK